MKPTEFAIMEMKQVVNDKHMKYNQPELRFKPAKFSDLLNLQKRINKKSSGKTDHSYILK